jgi:hypothetical protein
MQNPHAHHILYKKGIGEAQQALVKEGQAILRRYGIDPIFGPENLVWAPKSAKGQHGAERLLQLEDVERRVRDVAQRIDGEFGDAIPRFEQRIAHAKRRAGGGSTGQAGAGDGQIMGIPIQKPAIVLPNTNSILKRKEVSPIKHELRA